MQTAKKLSVVEAVKNCKAQHVGIKFELMKNKTLNCYYYED